MFALTGKTFTSFIVMVASSGIVVILFMMNPSPYHSKNGFKRNRLTNALVVTNNISVPDEVQRICGLSENSIYFTTKRLGQLYRWNMSVNAFQVLSVVDTVPSKTLQEFSFTQVYGSEVCIYGYNIPAIFRYSLLSNGYRAHSLPKGGFSSALMLDTGVFIFRKLRQGGKDLSFVKFNAAHNSWKWERDLSEYRNDGGLSTDGMLRYDSTTHCLVYLNYFRNSYIFFDTNLVKKGQGTTIDTFIHYRFQLSKRGDSNRFTNAGPDLLVNKDCQAYEGMLFVKSAIKSDNESSEDFGENDAIDLYAYLTGSYLGTMYVPRHHGQSFTDFRVFQNHLYLLYPGKLFHFKMSLKNL
jgi:hypothetical protein